MAASDSTPSAAARNQLRAFRGIVSDVVGELRSQQIRDTYSAITITELMQAHLVELVDGAPGKQSRKQRLDALVSAFKANLDAMKATPPDNFRTHDPQGDVNTAP